MENLKKLWNFIQNSDTFKKLTSFGLALLTIINCVSISAKAKEENDSYIEESYETTDEDLTNTNEEATDTIEENKELISYDKIRINRQDIYGKDDLFSMLSKIVAFSMKINEIYNEHFAPRELTLMEKEKIVRYLFDVEDETKWKELVCVIFVEGGCNNPDESYNVTSTGLLRITTNLWVKSLRTNELYKTFTNGQFTAYKNTACGYYTLFNLSLDDLRKYPAYEGIINCLFSEVPSHDYSEFRSKGSKVGTQLCAGGNKYLHKVSQDDFIPFEDRPQYQKIDEIMHDPSNELFSLLIVVESGKMPILDYYIEQQNALIEAEKEESREAILKKALKNKQIYFKF